MSDDTIDLGAVKERQSGRIGRFSHSFTVEEMNVWADDTDALIREVEDLYKRVAVTEEDWAEMRADRERYKAEVKRLRSAQKKLAKDYNDLSADRERLRGLVEGAEVLVRNTPSNDPMFQASTDWLAAAREVDRGDS